MKEHLILFAAALTAACTSSALAQSYPGVPEENGLNPKTATVYVNRQTTEFTTINNGNTESLGVAIANGGNVIVGWEDDHPDEIPMEYLGAIWTMFDSAGVSITPDTGMTLNSLAPGETSTNKFLSYFRADGSAVGGATSWGPKIQANLFGDGVGMGATSYALSDEVAELAAYDGNNQGDFPTVQLLSNAGQPVKIVAGISSAYATRDGGNIRIGDWGYLSNGNIVIVGESRQNADLKTIYGGETEETHAIFRIVDPAGAVVKAETLVSEVPVKSEIWHGVGVTQDGFAVRFGGPGGATVRMFDNAGNPKTGNLDLGTLTEHPEAAGGGRGDSAGFHGNGKDAYVAVSASASTVWVTVLNTDGTVRYSKSVADDVSVSGAGRADAAIDPDGNVIVVFDGKYEADYPSLVMGRRFNATGAPVGGTFYISERELPDLANQTASSPRIAWRAGEVAVVWQSNNDLETLNPEDGLPRTVVAMRLFSTFNPGSLESVGLNRIVADTPVYKPDTDSLNNWEPYASVLGNSAFLIEGTAFAEGTAEPAQRYVVAIQPVAGGPMKMVEGFYADNGQPYKGQINLSRQDGNPGRVAGDTRPGAVNYMVGGEASPHGFSDAFGSDNRWNLGFDRLVDGRYGVVQAFKLDLATLTPTPLSKALDSANGRLTSGEAAGNQISRFGGDIVGLDNGNFASVVEDRSRMHNPDGNAVVATIFAPDGTAVTDSFLVAPTEDATARDVDIWANVAPIKGGFAVRTKDPEGTSRMIYFFDNTGKRLGAVDQALSDAKFDAGRGDGTRLFGHINSPYVYLVGKATTGPLVKVAVFDSRDASFVTVADVSEGGFSGDFDRAVGAVDALNRMVISWVVKPAGYAQQQVAARVLKFDAAAKKITPMTASFFPFVNTATNDIRSLQMSAAMTTKQICIAAKGEINYQNNPAAGPNSPKQVNFYTVFSHPDPQNDPTGSGGTGGDLTVTSVSASAGNLVLTWSGGAAPYKVQKKAALTDANWVDVTTTSDTTATVPMQGAAGFFRVTGP